MGVVEELCCGHQMKLVSAFRNEGLFLRFPWSTTNIFHFLPMARNMAKPSLCIRVVCNIMSVVDMF